ncbi:MAG: cytochrome c [Terriglobia bacterium]
MNKMIITFFAVMSTLAGVALAADSKEGEATFDKSCKMCHGEKGATPNPNISKMLGGVTIPVLGSPEVQAKSDADLKKVITNGKGKMPAVKSVTGAAIDDVVAYLRTLKK